MPSRFPRYEKLLKLYPKAYRDKYGAEMLQTLEDMLDDQPSSSGRAMVWLRTCLDLPLNVLNQNTLAIGDNFIKETPDYIKQNGIFAGLLLVPFFLIVFVNAIDRAIFNHTLYHSWLWSQASIITWIVVFPSLAIAIAVYSYLTYLFSGSGKNKLSIRKKILDVRHTWPVIISGVFAAGVILILLFHDSAHCWRQSPVYFVTKWHQTWQCTIDGFLGG